ncbi:hypothetical protein VOLCADRAFT_100854 [Volvox carteri f. nagariensis]|uniref:Tyr recombinase domain-containing protein n=1 Tax=Volvox carteri f. nagariensis TaxID=3068 RepID=D8UL68_VOLCA|nr:uncharacterized protein VOLCADRAFT_100854 [Volvox carteri f. nagariensis]EFJ39531.1 hypothetical protein VOLCADRAFT_100854 [Volvox carteri f. nagariensis]|eukprot:XP_002959402.1 hypothetical protein VOLCADRAFT_100854 [Volvox carteri f. nagariensis]
MYSRRGSPATGAAVVTTAIQQNITPLQQQMAEQSQLLASMAKGKLALALLAEDPPNVKGATKVLKPLIRRAEVGMAVTNTLAAEPRIGLAAADICFSILCNEDKFRDKTKPRKLVDGVKDQALKRAASRSGPIAVRLCARHDFGCQAAFGRGQGLGLLWRIMERARACLSWPVLHVYEFFAVAFKSHKGSHNLNHTMTDADVDAFLSLIGSETELDPVVLADVQRALESNAQQFGDQKSSKAVPDFAAGQLSDTQPGKRLAVQKGTTRHPVVTQAPTDTAPVLHRKQPARSADDEKEKRLHGRPLQRDALEPEDIAALARLVEGPEVRLDYLMMVAAVAIMFAGFFRFDDAAEICVHVDLLLISASHMEIFIPRSKTDQLMRGHWVVIARSGGPCCPVGLTERLLELGGNSMAADRGVPAELRKAHGRWRTDAMVQHYMRHDTAAKLEVSRRLGLAGAAFARVRALGSLSPGFPPLSFLALSASMFEST